MNTYSPQKLDKTLSNSLCNISFILGLLEILSWLNKKNVLEMSSFNDLNHDRLYKKYSRIMEALLLFKV